MTDLTDGMTIALREKPVSLRTIAIIGNPYGPEELVKKARDKKAENYPVAARKREVFQRSNTASYITTFDLSLKKSNVPELDDRLVKEMVDSLPRYSRSYNDYLYTLYTIPSDSGKTKNKMEGIKNVVLKEDNGGGLDRIKRIVTELFIHKEDSGSFWKYKTGIFTFREKNIKISTGANASDSAWSKNLFTWHVLHGDRGWDWDFIQKTGRYKYANTGITPVGSEDAYAISFTGRSGGDYQGMIYISVESLAILRLEYSLKERRRDKGVDMLGISYSEENDDGLVIWEKDRQGYTLKYSMRSTVMRYGVDRKFELVRKEKRPLFNRKTNEADLAMNLQGRQEACYETLVVQSEPSGEAAFRAVKEKGVKPERITAYSDAIWKGYSIIEPTRQMKEYRVRLGKGAGTNPPH
jgi:hypothetical protein